MKSYSLITVLSLAAAANAHFTLEYPASRGDNDQSQATGPCGGLNTPSDTRTPWGLEGGVLRFEAGHDEANTAVYLALGNNPTTEDFNITLAPKFLQTGLGTFCWNSLVIPEGTAGIEDGVNATIQVVQEGHTGGGLYNCADITFVSDPPLTTTDCANSTGIGAEAAADSHESHPSATDAGAAPTTTPNAAAKLSSSVLMAGVLGIFGFIL